MDARLTLTLVLSAATSVAALRLPAATSRRSLLAAAPAAFAAAAPALAIKQTGYAANAEVYACRGDADCGMKDEAARRVADTPMGEPAGIRIAGTYTDPQHPGCTRRVSLQGSNVLISGADEDGKPWRVSGKYKGKLVLIDFTPKGGPKDVLATYNGIGLVFPDGNVWTRK